MSTPDALDLEVHRAQRALDLAKNESRIRHMTTHPAPLPPDFYTKTLTNITNLRQEYDHDDTLHRLLGDAEAAIANLIVLEEDAREDAEGWIRCATNLQRERDASRDDVETLGARLDSEKARAASEEKRLRDANKQVATQWQKSCERLTVERDEARAAIPALEKTIAFLEHDRDETRKAFDIAQGRLDAAIKSRDAAISSEARLIKERDDALENVRGHCHDLARLLNVRPGESILGAASRLTGEHLNAVNRAIEDRAALENVRTIARDGANERARDWATRYEALFAQSTHLAREVDRLNREKADRIEAKPSTGPIKVGDRVVSAGECATVIGFFTSIAGVEFLAVETMLRGGLGRPYFWRLDLCNPAPVRT